MRAQVWHVLKPEATPVGRRLMGFGYFNIVKSIKLQRNFGTRTRQEHLPLGRTLIILAATGTIWCVAINLDVRLGYL